jgi:ABC-type nitrate/sulfonate/bicarbonate transport system substrate-binding protein
VVRVWLTQILRFLGFALLLGLAAACTAQTGAPPAAPTSDSGAKIKLVAGSTTVPSYRVAVGKDIKSWADLKGKTISLGGPNDVT